jgi:metal-responsive CopG/Arc/MetJ family transcriptional regulator
MEKKMLSIGVRVTWAQHGWLGKIVRESGRNRSEIVRDAIDTKMKSCSDDPKTNNKNEKRKDNA